MATYPLFRAGNSLYDDNMRSTHIRGDVTFRAANGTTLRGIRVQEKFEVTNADSGSREFIDGLVSYRLINGHHLNSLGDKKFQVVETGLEVTLSDE